MALTEQEEKRVIKHVANITNELAAIAKILESDEAGDYSGTRDFISRVRRYFRQLLKAGAGEMPVENV